jgi:hypothetical protein
LCLHAEVERLRQHKHILLELVREGSSGGSNIAAFVRWQQRAEFIVRNEAAAPSVFAALEAALALLPATEFHGDHYGGYSTPSRAEVLAARALVAAALGRT